MPKQKEDYTRADRDLLIQIDTKLERVITDVQELKDNFASRVSELENEKVDKTDFELFRKQVNPIINNFYKIIGGLIILNVLGIPVLIYFLSKH